MRQPDDPGVEPRDWKDKIEIDPLGAPEPFDPDPMKRLRESSIIRAYIAIVILVIVASFVFWE